MAALLKTALRRALLAAALAPAPLAGQAPLGGNFRVNTFTTGDQAHPSLAADAAGNFVVVWHSLNETGGAYSVVARRYDASGQALDPSGFRVNEFTPGSHSSPAVAAAPAGGMVIAWHSTGRDGSGHGVYARRYDASGAPAGGEFRVNAHTAGDQNDAAVAVDDGGGFVVAWTSQGQDGSGQGVFARRYDAAGAAIGGELPVNAYTTGDQLDASVASAPDGRFVVTWRSAGQDGDGLGVFARRFDADGTPLGAEFRVSVHTTGDQTTATVAGRPDGGFVVAWASGGQDGSGAGVFARRYDPSGVALGGEFPVNAYVTGFQGLPAVSADDGGFVVTWTSELPDDDRAGVRARRFDGSGAPVGGELHVNTFTTGYQMYSVAQVLPEGRFVVAWISYAQDGSAWGVYGQRFAADAIFADGFESGDVSAWSASAGGGDLAVAAEAALRSTTAGLRGVVDDQAALYVQDDSPADERRYRARFYFDPNGFDPGEPGGRFRVRLFVGFEEDPTRRLFAIVLRRQGGSYSLMGRARLDDDAQAETGFFPIADGPHFVELEWVRASGPGAGDGSFALWIDGVPAAVLTGLDNGRSAVDFVRLGALSVKAGASGALHWDEFESRRQGTIGP